MYNHTKVRQNRFSGRSRGGRSGGKRDKSIDPRLFVNRAVETAPEAEFVPTHSFADFQFDPAVTERVTRRGFSQPTPVQDGVIPLAMAGHDVIGIANTGTGKTAAFLLPLINKTLADRRQKTLIIAPTRELAVQITDELRAFTPGLPIFSALCIGGSGFGSQVKALQRRPQFIIGTPGRLKDHLRQRTLYLNDVSNLVLDEVDRLIDMGFIADVRSIVDQLPAKRQTLLFSATVDASVRPLAAAFTQNAQTVEVKSRDTSQNVDQDVVYYTDAFHKLTVLLDLLAQPALTKVLIFGRTKHGVEKLNESLQERGFSSVSIHGNKNQSQRQRALQDFKENRAQIMVATDVAARGLDIPLVSHVINYDQPQQYADYVHRIGRTGRADNKGTALTFVQGSSFRSTTHQ